MPGIGVRAAALAAAAIVGGLPGNRSEAQDAADAPKQFLVFGGAEIARTSGFAHSGFVWSPSGINVEGSAFKALAGAGAYRYWSGAQEITGDQLLVSLMPGWRFKRETFETTLFAGLDLQSNRLHPYDPGNRIAGSRAGLRLAGEYWWEPTVGTMANGWASWSSIGTSYSARTAFGWRAFDAVYLGPEAQALGDGSYRELRIGLHATAWRIGPFEWSAGLGYARSDTSGGAYARLGVLTRQ